MKKFKKIERKGLPGGPNEQFTYITGVFSTEGYKSDSPDVNNPFNIIDSGNITMEGVDFPVMGTDNLGNSQMMMPGMNYEFPGDQVFEIPMAQTGGGLTRQLRNFEYDKKRNKRFAQEGGEKIPDITLDQIKEKLFQTAENAGNPGFYNGKDINKAQIIRMPTKDNPDVVIFNFGEGGFYEYPVDWFRTIRTKTKPVSLLDSSGIMPIDVDDSIEASQINVQLIPTSYEAIITPDANMANSNPFWMSKEIKVEGDKERMEELLKMYGDSRSRDIQINPMYKQGGMAQDGIEIPKRIGTRKNVDGSESTHLMKAEQLEDGTWVAFPSLFQNQDGQWIDMSGEEDWMNIYNEALKRGEVINFGDDKESAIKFGEGSWKSKMKKGGSVSWQWKGKTYSGTLIPSMENEKNRYARTENGKIKTLPKRQDGGEKSFLDKIKDNFLYNVNPLYQVDDALQILGVPANVIREAIEGIGNKGDGSFDFKNIIPDVKGTTILDDTPDQKAISESLGIDNVVGGFATDMLLDPTTYIGAGVIKNLLKKGSKETIKKAAPKIIKESKNVINISDTPKSLPRPPKEDYTFYRYAEDDKGILDPLDFKNTKKIINEEAPENLTFFAPTPYGFKGYGGKLFGANIVPKKPYTPYKGQVWDVETVQKLIDEGYDAIIPMYGKGDDIRDAYEIIPLDKSIIKNLEIIRALGGESLPMNQVGGLKTLIKNIAKKTDDLLPKLQAYLRSTYRGADEFVSEIDWGKWNEAIPKNKPLLEEYNLIEKTTKANKTWMKNPDGTPFSGTPEQFVQINSKNFKKAFPEGYQSVYRGVPGEDIEKYGPLGKKPNLGSGIFTAEEDVAKHYNFHVGSTRRDGHTLNLAMRNSDNSLVLDALGNFHADLNVIGTSKEMLKKNIDIFKKRLQQSIDDGVDPEVVMKINRNSASNLPAKLESYENFYKNYDEIVSNPVYQKLVKYKKDLLNSRKGTKKPGFNNFSTDDLVEFLQKEKLDNIQLRYVDDGSMGNTNIHNQVPGNYLKSLQGNDGMFDMSNPDIYKQKGGEYDPYMDIDPESQKRRDELLAAIDKVVETQGGDPNLKALLIMTAAMENSLGADSSAYGRDYTRGPMSMDDIAYITNFEVGKGANDYSKTQKKYFDWFESLGFDLENMDYHQRNNVLANVAGARMQYGLVNDPLPKADDPEAMYKYYMDFYNRTKADHKDRFMKNYNAFIKGKEKGGEVVYKIYKKFMQGGFTGNEKKQAEKIFDKLNRVHYKDAKKLGMTPTNYMMTFVIPNS